MLIDLLFVIPCYFLSMFCLFCIYFDVLSVLIDLIFLIVGDWTMVGGIKRITSLFSKPTTTRKGSDATEGSGRRPRGRPRGWGKGGGKTRPPSPVPLSPSELPFAHSSSKEEEVQVEEEAGMEEEIGGTSSSSTGVWLRGPSTLLKRPIPLDRRPLIRPDGEK